MPWDIPEGRQPALRPGPEAGRALQGSKNKMASFLPLMPLAGANVMSITLSTMTRWELKIVPRL